MWLGNVNRVITLNNPCESSTNQQIMYEIPFIRSHFENFANICKNYGKRLGEMGKVLGKVIWKDREIVLIFYPKLCLYWATMSFSHYREGYSILQVVICLPLAHHQLQDRGLLKNSYYGAYMTFNNTKHGWNAIFPKAKYSSRV